MVIKNVINEQGLKKTLAFVAKLGAVVSFLRSKFTLEQANSGCKSSFLFCNDTP